MTEVRDQERDEIEQVIAKWREAPAYHLSETGHRAYQQRCECADELEAVLRRSRAVPPSLRELLVRADSYLSLLWYRHTPPNIKADSELRYDVERTIGELREASKGEAAETRAVPPTTIGGNETIIDEDGIYQSRPPRPFAALRAKMPPESQVRAAARTEEMLSEIRTAETRAVLPEPPCCERHGVMVARDQMGREWYCAVCGIVSPDTDTTP